MVAAGREKSAKIVILWPESEDFCIPRPGRHLGRGALETSDRECSMRMEMTRFLLSSIRYPPSSSSMRRFRLEWLLVTVLLLLGGGCYHYVRSSDAQRAASFAALREARVGDETLKHFVRRRTAVMVWGANASAAHASPGGQTVIIDFDPQPRMRLGYGHAAAITADGYFLTAGHCVEEATTAADGPASSIYLVYFDAAGPRVAPARLVARVQDERSAIDVAIVQAAAERTRVPETFHLAATGGIKKGSAAVAVGFAEPIYLGRRMKYFAETCLGGRVAGSRRCTSEACAAIEIFSDLPLRPGDSGGPLVSAIDGKLIGVNTRGLLSWTGSKEMVAGSVLPDEKWVRRVIEADRQRPHEPVPAVPTTMPSTRPNRRVRSLLFSLDGDEVVDGAIAGGESLKPRQR